MDESFPKTDRLLKRNDFVRVQKHGRKLHTKSLLILIHPNGLSRNRIGVAVSKKYGNSVQRNRIKRLVRELFRRNRGMFAANSDIVVVPKRVRHTVTYNLLLEEFKDLGRRR